MRIDLTGGPAYTIAYVILDHDERVHCEPGSMVAMSGGVSGTANVPGGVVRGALRHALGTEAFFSATYHAYVHGAWVALAPRYPGDVAVLEVAPGQELAITSGALLGHAGTVDVTTGWAGLRSVVLKEGATVLSATGHGPVLVCSYGALNCVTLRDGETLIVDTGHIAAWDRSMGLRIGPLGGVVESKFTGEGMVGQFTGPGRVWIQTRAEQQLRSWLLPQRDSNDR